MPKRPDFTTAPEEIARRVRVAMAVRDVRSSDLADHLGVKRQTISNLPRRRPNRELLNRIAAALAVSPEFLAGAERPMLAVERAISR